MPDRTRRSALAGALGLLTLVAFLPCLDNGFVRTWDDGPNILDNPHVGRPGWPALAWAWRTFLLGVYQPLAWLLFFAQAAVCGPEAWGFHLVSLLWHGLNSILLFLLTCVLLDRARSDLAVADRTWGAAIAAALFAVHPLRVEVVAWVSCQPYLPCVFFCLLCLLLFLRAPAAGRDRLRRLVVCWVLFLVALLFKSLAVPLPLVLLVLDAYPLRRLGPEPRAVWFEKLPFLVLSGILAVVAYRARSSLEAYAHPRSLSSRLAQVGYSLVYYPIKTVVPTGLLPFHPIRSETNIGEPLFQLCALGVVVLSIALFLTRRRWPGLLAAWVSYVLLIAPTSGIVSIGSMLVADRYSYLATMGGYVVAGGGVAALGSRGGKRHLNLRQASVGLVLILGLLPLTWRQCRIWSSAEAIWNHAARSFAEAVRSSPASAEAHHNLGITLYYCGQLDEAIDEFHAALKLDPTLADTQGSLAQALIDSGRGDEAMAALSEALRLDPNDAEYHGNLALLLIRQGRLDEARAEYQSALRQQPRSASWHAGLGVALFRQGRTAEAAAELSEAVRLNPDEPHFRDQLRQVRQALGRR
jgi:tetratricopeptide (TPR) repeat protein